MTRLVRLLITFDELAEAQGRARFYASVWLVLFVWAMFIRFMVTGKLL